jgi:tRNA U55 pseudouridine synthase TruB
LGQNVGCGAHLLKLRRSTSGKFDVQQALPLDSVLALSSAQLENHVIPFLKLAGGTA